MVVLQRCVCFQIFFSFICASFHEQYRVPNACSERWESYVYNDKEYVVQNLPVTWENAKILCRGQHNGSMVVLDTKEKAEFLAEALSESQFAAVDSVWVGARRDSADDPAGYRWGGGVELRRTALDVLANDLDDNIGTHYPLWQNRTHVPVPEGGADCVALQRMAHDKPVFLDLPCLVERAFVCEREAKKTVEVTELKTVRCRSGMYHVYDGKLDWHQAAAYCVLRKMTLANIDTMKCLKKLGMTMLKTRPSIENAWIGAKGSLGRWTWIDTGLSIFAASVPNDKLQGTWPPMRDRLHVKQSGCLQLDRHATHSPVFMEARCERKLQFICYQSKSLLSTLPPPSDDTYNYVLVRQQLYWQHAFENCQQMNGTLAGLDNADLLLQLLLVMGENKQAPIGHIWVSGRLNMSKESDTVSYSWYNPGSGRRIPDPKSTGDVLGLFMPPWLDEEFSLDNSCLNLDRQDHLTALVYGLPCDTPQYSICLIEKSVKSTSSIENASPSSGFESS